jgi:peptide deformylase
MTTPVISKDTIVKDKTALAVRCEPLTEANIGEEIALINAARAWVADAENGALGLASSQVGSKRAWFVMKNTEQGRQINPTPGSVPILAIANPKIIEFKGATVARRESCFSLPDERFDLRRNTDILVRYQLIGEDGSLTGVKKAIFSGLAAQVLQHEFGHLRGVLICDFGEPVVAQVPVPAGVDNKEPLDTAVRSQ